MGRGGGGYVVVIDAGSTGSRVHVHAYAEGGEGALPKIFPSETTKVKPGLSAYADRPDEAAGPVEELVAFAVRHVPERLQEATSVFLRATAGLRALPAARQEAILQACRAVLGRSPFRFEREWASVISGADEGVYGWLTVNYLEGALGRGAAEDTVGVLEMGGASVQITFVPGDEAAREHPGTLAVRLGRERVYRVYTHSYMEYGLDEAMRLFDRLNAARLREAGEHPCFPRDFAGAAGALVGVGDQGRCARMMDPMFRKPDTCAPRHTAFEELRSPPRCEGGFNGVWQPRMTGRERFVAIENFFYTCEFFGGLEDRRPWDVVRDGGAKFCQMEWRDIPSRFSHETESDLSRYCFNSAYSNRMLRDGFGLDPSAARIEVVRRINGTAIDWAMGAALVEVTRATPSPHDDLHIDAHPGRHLFMDVTHPINAVPAPPGAGEAALHNALAGVAALALAGAALLAKRWKGRGTSHAGHAL